MSYILFSPIGNTDPIRNYRDGAWLHICRHYRPRLAVIYLSAEMCRKEDVIEPDGRRKDLYVRTLDLLNRHLYGDHVEEYIRLECIRDPECEEAHALDIFVPKFQDILTRIHQEHPDDDILVNVSSGTAGMKSMLIALSALLPFKVQPVQVSDPKKGVGKKSPIVDEHYPVDEAFEFNEDNEPDAESRVSLQPLIHLVLAMQINELCRLVREGDYHTALQELRSDSMKAHVDDRTLSAVLGAERRSSMNLEEAGKALELAGLDMGRQIRKHANDRIWQCAEYLLTMRIDLMRGTYDAFMRKLTPLLTNLCELYLAKVGKDVRKNGVNTGGRWVLSRMPEEWVNILDATFPNGFNNNTPLAAANMVPLIKRFGEGRASQLAEELRTIEDKVRNAVAHEIIPFSRSDVEKALKGANVQGITSPEALADRLQKFIGCIQPFDPAYWNSYDVMNERICDMLKDCSLPR